jgi:NodT family efflux transporter outer membrane factor (OMF) lipoprotein
LVGCLPYDPVHNPAPPVELPPSYTVGGEAIDAPAERDDHRAWWEDFGDPQLTAMLDRLLENNLELRAAWARVVQARALATQAGSALWPSVGVEASVSRQRQRFGTIPAQEFNSYSLSAPVAYEVDLFGRIGAEATAAEIDAHAARDDAEALALALAAQLAERWFALLDVRARRALLAEQVETSETYLGLVEVRFRQGLSGALDVHQQSSQLSAARAQLELIEAQHATVESELAVLLGQWPGEPLAAERIELPSELPPIPSVGVPADLLLRRPDVRAAQRRVIAADYRVGAAIADWFPRLNLRAGLGFGATSLAQLFEEIIWSIGATLSEQIIDGGRRGAEVRRRRAVVSERLDQFGQVLLTAVGEVQSALVQAERQGAYIGELEAQLGHAEAALREARARYTQGLSDYLTVLTTLDTYQRLQVTMLTAHRQQLSDRIQIYRALGGTWTQELTEPELHEPREMGDVEDDEPEGDEPEGADAEGTGQSDEAAR